MKKLHLYIIKSYLGPLVLTFFITMFVLLMQFLFRYIDELIGKGLETELVAQFLFYTSVGLIPMALPLAILLASLMTFGTLSEEYELTAMKAAGISLQRIFRPLIIFSIFISIGAFFFSNYVLPVSNLKTGYLLWEIRNQRPELDIKEGIFNNNLENFTIRVGKKNKKTRMMYNFMLYDHTDKNGNTKVIISDSAKMYLTKDKKCIVLHLYKGTGYEELSQNNRLTTGKNQPMQKNSFDEERLIFELTGLELTNKDRVFQKTYHMKNLNELTFAEDSIRKANDSVRQSFTHDLYDKISANENIKVTDSTLFNYDNVYNLKVTDSILSLEKVNTGYVFRKKFVSTNNTSKNVKSFISDSEFEFKDRLRDIKRHQIEWHRKFTLSFACFIFFFIGAPLGTIIRRGGLGMPTVVSIFFFIIYYIISLTGEKFVREIVLPAYVGMWISSIILFPLGIFLTFKAKNDSQIFNIDIYLGFFYRMYDKIAGKGNSISSK